MDSILRIKIQLDGNTSVNDAAASQASSQWASKFGQALNGQANLANRLNAASGNGLARITGQIGTLANGLTKASVLVTGLWSAFSLADRIGKSLAGTFQPIVDLPINILRATDEYRKFQVAISSVSGSNTRAASITQSLVGLSNQGPLASLQELDAARAGALIPGLSDQLSRGSAADAAGRLDQFATTRSQLAALSPGGDENSADRGIRTFLSGSSAGIQRQLGIDPSVLAGLIGRSLKDVLADPRLGLQALSAAGSTFVGNSSFENRSTLFSNALEKISDVFQQVTARIGNDSGLYDSIVSRIRGVTSLLLADLDPSQNPKWHEQEQRLGTAILSTIDSVYGAFTGGLQRLTGENNPVDSVTELVTRLFEAIAIGASLLPEAVAAMAAFGHQIAITAQDIAAFAHDPVGYVASDAGHAAGLSVASSAAGGAITTANLARTSGALMNAAPGIALSGAKSITANEVESAALKMMLGFVPTYAFGKPPTSAAPPSTSSASSSPSSGDAFSSLATSAQRYETEARINQILESQMAPGNSRLDVRSILSPLSEIGGDTDFQSKGEQSLAQQMNVANQVKARLTTGTMGDNRTLTYQDLLDAAQQNLAAVKQAPSTEQVTGISGNISDILSGHEVTQQTLFQQLAGAMGSQGATTYFSGKYQDASSALDAVKQLPNILQHDLQNVAGSIADQLDSLPPTFASQLGHSLEQNGAGLADSLSDALKLNPQLRQQLKDAVSKGPEALKDLIATKTFDSDLRNLKANLPQTLPSSSAQLLSMPFLDNDAMAKAELTLRTARQTQLAGQYDSIEQAGQANGFSQDDLQNLAQSASLLRDNQSALIQLQSQLNTTQKAYNDFATGIRDAIQTGIGDSINGLITGTETLSQAFKNMANSIVRDFSDMEAKLITQELLGNFGVTQSNGQTGTGGIFGSLLGGIFNNIGKSAAPQAASTTATASYADGGIASRPTTATFGDAGPEAFIPLKRGGIPVQMMGSMQAEAPAVYVVDSPEQSFAKGFRANRDTMVNLITRQVTRGKAGKAIRQGTR